MISSSHKFLKTDLRRTSFISERKQNKQSTVAWRSEDPNDSILDWPEPAWAAGGLGKRSKRAALISDLSGR